MVKNYFYLIVGLLCVLFAVTHTWNGLTTALPILDAAAIDSNMATTFTYVWHIIGIENLIFGIALLIMAFQKDMAKVRFAAWIIMVVMALRWLVIASFTVLNNSGVVKQILPDTIAIFVVIVLLWFGTWVKDKIPVK